MADKEAVIEYIEYNTLISLLDYIESKFTGKSVYGKTINIMQSYSDKNFSYVTPSLSIEILHRKNRPIAFGDFLFEIDEDTNIVEIEGLSLEYSVQFNVYSNTRGEIHKWSSILDDVLKNGETRFDDSGNPIGIPLNVYSDDGTIITESIGIISYDYSSDVKNNNIQPNVVTYDFHTIYEIKMNVIQKYKTTFGIAEIGDQNGNLK